MGTTNFREYSDVEAIVEVQTALDKSMLIVHLNPDHISLAIIQDDEDLGSFCLYNPEAQKLFNWLKSKNVLT